MNTKEIKIGQGLGDIKFGISKEDLEFTKNALIKSNARRFETQGSLLGMLQNISNYNLSKDETLQ